ncbi:MAG TPA: HEPN domain-containing protein [Acidobacteriaceae bacterium]|jgi:HEPN domain-containing protein
MSVSSSQANIIDELFVRTADENYITARWCAIHRLHTDFAWLAVHALEKYLKAVLLYNGKQAKKHGHDIEKLYQSVKSLTVKHLPKILSKPPDLVIGHWFERTPENFIEHLYRTAMPPTAI